MRKLIDKIEPDIQARENGALRRERPTQVFSLNDERFHIKRKTSHAIPGWIRFEEELYFITICCKGREVNQLCIPSISSGIFSALEFYAQRQMIFPKLVLLMPDHLHGIFAFSMESGINKPISVLKRYLAKNYRLSFQDGFFEHRIRDNEHRRQIEDYILNNPIRKKLADSPEQWKYTYRSKFICTKKKVPAKYPDRADE